MDIKFLDTDPKFKFLGGWKIQKRSFPEAKVSKYYSNESAYYQTRAIRRTVALKIGGRADLFVYFGTDPTKAHGFDVTHVWLAYNSVKDCAIRVRRTYFEEEYDIL